MDFSGNIETVFLCKLYPYKRLIDKEKGLDLKTKGESTLSLRGTKCQNNPKNPGIKKDCFAALAMASIDPLNILLLTMVHN